MKRFTGIPQPFLDTAHRAHVRYDWRRRCYIATCSRCRKAVVIEDRFGNDVRDTTEFNEIARGHDRVRGDTLFYAEHVTKIVIGVLGGDRCSQSRRALGTRPRDAS